MDFQALLKQLGPVIIPLLDQGVDQLWSQVDMEIAKIGQADVKLVLAALSPGLKAALKAEIAKLAQ